MTGTGFVLVVFAFDAGDFFKVTTTALGWGGAGGAGAALREKRALRLNRFLPVSAAWTAGSETAASLAEVEVFFTGDTAAAGGLATCFTTDGAAGAFRDSAKAGWIRSPVRIAENRRRGFTPES